RVARVPDAPTRSAPESRRGLDGHRAGVHDRPPQSAAENRQAAASPQRPSHTAPGTRGRGVATPTVPRSAAFGGESVTRRRGATRGDLQVARARRAAADGRSVQPSAATDSRQGGGRDGYVAALSANYPLGGQLGGQIGDRRRDGGETCVFSGEFGAGERT